MTRDRKTPPSKLQLEVREKVARESKRELKRRAKEKGEGQNPATAKHNTTKPPKRPSARQAALDKAFALEEAAKSKQRRADADAQVKRHQSAKSLVESKPLRIDLANPEEGVLEAEPAEESVPTEHLEGGPIGKKLSKAERRVQALNMKIVGHDYRVIAETLGVNVSTAYFDVQEALVYLAKHERVLAERVREMELARFDALQTMVWPNVERGDPFAVQAYLKIMDQRARMLGLYAAEKLEVSSARPLRTLTDAELQARTEQLLATIKRNALPPGTVEGEVVREQEPGQSAPAANNGTSEWSDQEPDVIDTDTRADTE